MPLFLREGNCVLFVHIPKCAGSSIEDALRELSDTALLISDRPCADLPCTPQHVHVGILRRQIPDVETIASFAVVRHPLLRLISEHQYRNKLLERRRQQPLGFSRHMRQLFFEYRFNNMSFDNHIRPQCEFVFPHTEVFRLESGIESPLRYARQALGLDDSDTPDGDISRKNVSEYQDFTISQRDIAIAEDFYAFDFEMFGYKKLDITPGEAISYSEIRAELESPFAGAYEYSESLLQRYAEHKKRFDSSANIASVSSAARYLTKLAYKGLSFIR